MFTHLEVARGPWAAGPGSEVGCQGSRCQVGLASCPASGVSTSSFPPAPSESCRFSLPAGGNTPPEEVWKGKEDVRSSETLDTSQTSINKALCATIRAQMTYPRVRRLVHVALNFSCVSHQILHSPILKCSWIRSGEDGLHSARTEITRELKKIQVSGSSFVKCSI